MNIEVRLFATLRQYLPPGSSRASAQLELPAAARVVDVLERLGIPAGQAALVLIDGRYEADRHRRLDDDCVLSVFPKVAGG